MKNTAQKIKSAPALLQQSPGFMITLRSARENLYLTLEEVSAKTGMSVNRIKNLEFNCNKARYDEFVKLVRLYGLTPSHIFVGKETECFQAIECYLDKQKSPATSAKIV